MVQISRAIAVHLRSIQRSCRSSEVDIIADHIRTGQANRELIAGMARRYATRIGDAREARYLCCRSAGKRLSCASLIVGSVNCAILGKGSWEARFFSLQIAIQNLRDL